MCDGLKIKIYFFHDDKYPAAAAERGGEAIF